MRVGIPFVPAKMVHLCFPQAWGDFNFSIFPRTANFNLTEAPESNARDAFIILLLVGCLTSKTPAVIQLGDTNERPLQWMSSDVSLNHGGNLSLQICYML